MTIIPANDLKTKGIKAIEEALIQHTEVSCLLHPRLRYLSGLEVLRALP